MHPVRDFSDNHYLSTPASQSLSHRKAHPFHITLHLHKPQAFPLLDCLSWVPNNAKHLGRASLEIDGNSTLSFSLIKITVSCIVVKIEKMGKNGN